MVLIGMFSGSLILEKLSFFSGRERKLLIRSFEDE
jgi:hypothetical protein